MEPTVQSVFNEVKNIWEIKLSGEIDIYNSNDFKSNLNSLIGQHPSDLRLDCSALEYIDSTGLGALVAVLKKVKQYNGHIILVNVKNSILRIFKITDLDKVFVIEGDTLV